MIYTIGKWSTKSKTIREDLRSYLSDCGVIPQIASLEHIEGCRNHPRLWEYASAIAETNPINKKILDVGGLNNFMGWYLSEKCNCKVTQVGLCEDDMINLKKNLLRKPECKINGICGDIRKVDIDEQFDIVYSINVIEHIREYARAEKEPYWIQGKSRYWNIHSQWEKYAEQQEMDFVQSLAKFVKHNGLLCITYDYKQCRRWKPQNKCAYFRSIDDIIERIVNPSGLRLVGDIDLKEYPPMGITPRASTGIVILRK